MFDLIREHQLDIMLVLCAFCALMAIMLLITRFLPRRKKWILVMMELISMILLAFDRTAYIYRGDGSDPGFVMVRVSNFMVFFLTSAIVLCFNLYITDLLLTDGHLEKMPSRLIIAQFGAIAGMLLAVISAFSGLYYYFDENNVYHRGDGFLIAYLIPVIIPILQYTVILQYRKLFSRLIYFSLTLFIFVPIIFGIMQVFTYGISLVNMAMALVSIALYIFAYLDINNEVISAHKVEVANLEKEHQSMRRLFDQTATSFVTKEDNNDASSIESEITCKDYRENVTCGIHVTENEKVIHFFCGKMPSKENACSAPSIILFDSYDKHVHDNDKAIKAYGYLEYGEAWFDGNYVSTSARNMEVKVREDSLDPSLKENEYRITAKRYEDHVSIIMSDHVRTVDIIMALPYNSKAAYIGLTGENCKIRDITVEKTGKKTAEGEIREIVSKISYINRLESDLKNVQIDRFRSASTSAIPVKDEALIEFHSMSLPSATLVWHCPYVVIFSSKDGRVDGEDYREYALIKLNGEIDGDDALARNQFYMKKTDDFPGWDSWKEKNKKGMEYSISLRKRGNKVVLNATNLGVEVRNTTVLPSDEAVYAALTGDEIAITDIRIK